MLGKIVGEGCVGECGSKCTIEYIVKSKIEIMMIVKNVKTDLCPNTGAHLWIFVDGIEKISGSLTAVGSRFNTTAMPGSRVAVHVVTYPLFNNIVCECFGNLDFNLIEMDLV